MDQDRTIKKALFWMRQENIIDSDNLERAKHYLEMVYAAGYDERKKDYNQSQEKRVIQEDIHHKKVREHDSMNDARKRVGMSKAGMISAIKNKLLTRKGYYFRYATEDEK